MKSLPTNSQFHKVSRWRTAHVASILPKQMTTMRQEQRVSAVLPVRVSGVRGKEPFEFVAHTLNVSHRGALLSGVRFPLPVGSVICIRRGAFRAEFRVLWVTSSPHTPLQIGVECLHQVGNFWRLNQRGSVSPAAEFLAMLDRFSADGILPAYDFPKSSSFPVT